MDAVHSLLSRQDELEGLLRALDTRIDHFTGRSLELIDRRHHAAKQSVHRKSVFRLKSIELERSDELHKMMEMKQLLPSAC